MAAFAFPVFTMAIVTTAGLGSLRLRARLARRTWRPTAQRGRQ